jgi:hypothetical protein
VVLLHVWIVVVVMDEFMVLVLMLTKESSGRRVDCGFHGRGVWGCGEGSWTLFVHLHPTMQSSLLNHIAPSQ